MSILLTRRDVEALTGLSRSTGWSPRTNFPPPYG